MKICRCNFWYVNRSTLLSSSNVVVYLTATVSLSQFPTVSRVISPTCFKNMNRLRWESLTRWWSAAWKLLTPLLVRSWLFATDMRENDYGQIPSPLLPDSTTYKFHLCYLCRQIPSLANSAPPSQLQAELKTLSCNLLTFTRCCKLIM